MLIIRLQRTGKKNQAEFRIVLSDKTKAVQKKATEVLGNYSARKKVFNIKNEDRLKYWISQHVEISPTVHNLLVTKGLLDAKKVKAFSVPKKPVEPEAEQPKPVQAETAAEPKAEAVNEEVKAPEAAETENKEPAA